MTAVLLLLLLLLINKYAKKNLLVTCIKDAGNVTAIHIQISKSTLRSLLLDLYRNFFSYGKKVVNEGAV